MGIYQRPDSPFWWLWLETAPPSAKKEKTAILVGTTTTERRDNRRRAELVYAKRMAELATRIHRLPTARPTIRFDAYADTYARDVIAHQRGKDRAMEILKTLRAAFGNDLLHTIDRECVRAWMAVRRQAVAARTVNREVDVLKSMLRDAVPKYLEASPIAGMKELPVVPPKRRLMTPTEERKILKHLSPEDRAIFLVGLDCLVRLGDILDLRRDDDRGATLYIRDPKDPQQSAAYSVPISKRVRVALDALEARGPFYFPHRRRAESEQARRHALRAALKRACERARVPYGRKSAGITFHWATRRTGATRMLQRGAELKAVQAVGHWKQPDVMLEIYAEATSKAARRAVELVSAPARLPSQAKGR